MSNVSGKTVLITGASQGIGAAAARLFAQQGANVVACARSKDALEQLVADITTQGGKARVAVGDVSRYADTERAVQTAVDHFGGLDILINNAGIINPIARIEDCDPDDWHRVIDINVNGVFNGIRAAIAPMLERGGGRIINISSGAATASLEGWSHYCASKAAVLSLTRTAHKELSEKGINVIGLSPGTVKTEMQVSIRASGINPVSQLDPDSHRSPEDVAKALEWLCGEAARDYAGDDFSIKTAENRALVGIS